MRQPKEYASVSWCWEDVKTLRPDWSRARCEAFLQRNAKHIAEAMVSTGWDVLHYELPPEPNGGEQHE